LRFQLGSLPENQDGPPEAEGSHRIHSPSPRLGYLLAGLIGLLFPLAICGWLIVVSALAGQREGGETLVQPSTPWGVVALALLLCTPLHELLHAIWHPQLGLSPQTVIVIWPKRLRFGVYYEGCMTRRRWLMMRLAPFIVLVVIPAGLLTLFHYVPAPFALETFLQVIMLVNGIGSGGDVVAVIWVLRQVPSKAQICFCGGKAYWGAASPPGQVVLPSA
jgi:hypothetical protein